MPGNRKPTRREIAQAIQTMAPAGRALPGWVEQAANRKLPEGPRKHVEDTFHISLVKMLRQLPATIIWHTPSTFLMPRENQGGFFNWINKLKARGWFGGIPDLCVIFRSVNGATTVVFMELKASKKDLADNQASFLDKANGIGCFTARIRTMEEAIRLLCLAGHPSFPPS